MPTPPAGANAHDKNDPWYSGSGYTWQSTDPNDPTMGYWVAPGAGDNNPTLSTTPGGGEVAQALLTGGTVPFAGTFMAGDMLGVGDQAGDFLAGGNPFQYTDEYYNAAKGLGDWQSYFDSFGGSARPANIGIDFSNSDASRQWQNSLIQDLQRQAAGDLNSRAQQSLAQGFDSARNQQMALGSAQRGTGGAAGLRAGQRGAGDVSRGQAGAQQMLMLQEQQTAQQQLAQMLAAQRGLDAQQANAYSQNWLANNQMQNDWVNYMNQQSLGTGLEQQQQQAELARAILGTDVSNRDFAQRAAGQGAQAVAGLAGAVSQMGDSGGSSSTASSPDEWYNYNPYDIRDGDK